MSDDLFVVMWANESEGRPFQTLTRRIGVPVAFSYSFLDERFSALLAKSTIVVSELELKSLTFSETFKQFTKDNPLIVSAQVARSAFGWVEFDVWDSRG